MMGTGTSGGTLTPDGFAFHWPDIERVLDQHPEMWADYHTKESLYQDAMDRNIQVWAFIEDDKIRVVLFTRLIEYPAARVLHVMMGFGNSLDRLLPQIEATLESFGQTWGCTLCEIVGREGWVKKLSHRFKKKAVVLVARIGGATVN
jgi:hypothetical protein